jgi:serine protease AprX
MHRRPVGCDRVVRLLVLLSIAVVAALAPSSASAHAEAGYIVQLRPGASDAQARALVRAHGGRVTGSLHIIHALGARLSARGARALAHDPLIRAVTPNTRVRPQDGGPDGSQLQTTYPATAQAPSAWPAATGKGVGVAVIDSGIAGGLPDFQGDDGTSRVVASAVVNPYATSAGDTYGHGTHVAGILAGDSTHLPAGDPLNGAYVGIAPDANLISIKVADDDGNATVLDVIYGLQFAVDHQQDYGIRVVNMSLESTTAQSYKTDPLDAAVESAYFHGMLVVVAAGNRGSDYDAGDYAPGNDPFAVSVGAVDDRGTSSRSDDVMADWSTRDFTQDGFKKPDILAPGAHIVSTLAPGSDFASLCPSCIVSGRYIRAGGTSMAAPVVSGVAALVFQLHPDWTAAQVKAALITTAFRLYGSSYREVDARASTQVNSTPSSIDPRVPPNTLVNASTGDIDYTRSSWSRSSWSLAAAGLTADWARSSWSCTCGDANGDGKVDPTRSSWSRSSWSTLWGG